MTNITLPGVLAAFTFEIVPTPTEMSVSSPSPGEVPVVIPNSDLIFGGFPVSNQKPLGEPNGIPVVIPNPQNRFVGGFAQLDHDELVTGGLSPNVHDLVPGVGLPIVSKDNEIVPGGIPGPKASPVVPGDTPFVVPPELVGIDGQFLGENVVVINGVSRTVVSPGGVPVVR